MRTPGSCLTFFLFQAHGGSSAVCADSSSRRHARQGYALNAFLSGIPFMMTNLISSSIAVHYNIQCSDFECSLDELLKLRRAETRNSIPAYLRRKSFSSTACTR